MTRSEIAILYNAPKPRQEWIDGKFVQRNEKNAENWVEWFKDLVYVAFLVRLSKIPHYCRLTYFVVFKVAIIFWSMCLTRQAIDEYANRFYSHDLLHKVIYLVYTCGVFIQVMNVNANENKYHGDCTYQPEDGLGISVGYLITRVSIISIYLLVMRHNEKAQAQFEFDILRWAVSVALMVINIIVHSVGKAADWIDITIMGIIVGLEILAWIYTRVVFRSRFQYPISLDLMQERWGVWVMMVIGESIIQMLTPTLTHKDLSHTYELALVSLILMFSLAMQYYDACQREWFDHAITKSAAAGVAWIWLHLPLSLALFFVGISISAVFACQAEGVPVEPEYVRFLSFSLGGVTAIFTFIRFTHTTVYRCERRDAVLYSIRLLVSGMQMSVAAWEESVVSMPTRLLWIHLLISLLLFNVVDVAYDVLKAHEKRVEKAKRKMEGRASVTKPQLSRAWSDLNITRNKSFVQKGNQNSLGVVSVHEARKSQSHSRGSRAHSDASKLAALRENAVGMKSAIGAIEEDDEDEDDDDDVVGSDEDREDGEDDDDEEDEEGQSTIKNKKKKSGADDDDGELIDYAPVRFGRPAAGSNPSPLTKPVANIDTMKPKPGDAVGTSSSASNLARSKPPGTHTPAAVSVPLASPTLSRFGSPSKPRIVPYLAADAETYPSEDHTATATVTTTQTQAAALDRSFPLVFHRTSDPLSDCSGEQCGDAYEAATDTPATSANTSSSSGMLPRRARGGSDDVGINGSSTHYRSGSGDGSSWVGTPDSNANSTGGPAATVHDELEKDSTLSSSQVKDAYSNRSTTSTEHSSRNRDRDTDSSLPQALSAILAQDAALRRPRSRSSGSACGAFESSLPSSQGHGSEALDIEMQEE